MTAKKDFYFVLDENIPLGELRFEKTVVLVNPASDLESVLRQNPNVKFSLRPRDLPVVPKFEKGKA